MKNYAEISKNNIDESNKFNWENVSQKYLSGIYEEEK